MKVELFSQESKEEVVQALKEKGVWSGRLAFEEFELWGLEDNYVNILFNRSDLQLVEGRTILAMKINMARKFLVQRAQGVPAVTEVLFFKRVTIE